jgi:hypothetical protein
LCITLSVTVVYQSSLVICEALKGKSHVLSVFIPMSGAHQVLC